MALLIPVSIRAPHIPPRIAVLWYGLSLVNQNRALQPKTAERRRYISQKYLSVHVQLLVNQEILHSSLQVIGG